MYINNNNNNNNINNNNNNTYIHTYIHTNHTLLYDFIQTKNQIRIILNN